MAHADDYKSLCDAAVGAPDRFWLEAARRIDWHTPPTRACSPRADGWHDWFAGARLNTCHNALDRHVAAGRGDQTALIWHCSTTGQEQAISYHVLKARVAGFAGGLRSLGVEKGDRVMIAMPTMIETVIAMLACARLGAVHVVVFAGYGAAELARRIDDAAPRFIIIASCRFQSHTPIACMDELNAALTLAAHTPDACIIAQRAAHPATLVPTRDHDFHALEQSAPVDPVNVRAEDPLYILHTSGTTGTAKGIVRDNGGHAVAMALSIELVYGCGPGDAFLSTSDLGWVVGHSYGVYAPLISGCTSVIVEGSASVATIRALCHDHAVKCLFTTPTQMRLMRQESRALSAMILPPLARIFVAGEYADPTLLDWARGFFQKPVVNHWWQTETGWSITAHFFGLDAPIPPHRMNDIGRPAPGFHPTIINADPDEACGEVMLALPLPPGCLAGLWRDGAVRPPDMYLDDTRRFYRTFDEGMIDADAYVHMLGRSDDVIKVAGRRISGIQIEKIVASHPDVHSCAVVATPDRLRGQRPVAYVVPRCDGQAQASLSGDIIRDVSRALGRWVGLREVRFVRHLPTTISGKITRKKLLVS